MNLKVSRGKKKKKKEKRSDDPLCFVVFGLKTVHLSIVRICFCYETFGLCHC